MLEFYFDFVSPYAYLAWHNPRTGPRALAARYRMPLAVHPVLFAGLLAHWGQLGPAEIAPKRAFLIKDVMRHAALASIPLTYPALHPFNPITLLRLALVEVSGPHQLEVIDALFALAWGRGVDVRDDAVVAAALPDGERLLARTRDGEVKAALKRETDDAIARGVFGVPTFIVRAGAGDDHDDAELFWGSDRADDVERYLAGSDPVDRALAHAAIAQPLGLSRKR